MFVTTNRVLVISRVNDDEGKTKRLRVKNGETFFTIFPSKKLPPLPDTLGEGSQIDASGFVKCTQSEKYGLQWTMTATAIVERVKDTGKVVSTTTIDGEPINTPPAKGKS